MKGGGLRARLARDGKQAGLCELVAGVLDPHIPERRLSLAQEIVAIGLRTWAEPDAGGRAVGLGLSRPQALRLRLLALIAVRSEEESWALPAPVTSPSQALVHLGDIRSCSQEKVVAIYLDARNRPLRREIIAIGGLRASVIQPRDVLAPTLGLPVAGIILAHNHPSGDPQPSPDDLQVTRQLAGAAQLFGIELMDHIIVTATRCVSIKEMGGL